jgi:hypothetical protein
MSAGIPTSSSPVFTPGSCCYYSVVTLLPMLFLRVCFISMELNVSLNTHGNECSILHSRYTEYNSTKIIGGRREIKFRYIIGSQIESHLINFFRLLPNGGPFLTEQVI